MSVIYQVRAEKGGMFSIYKNDIMIVYNLDSSDVKSFCSIQKDFGSVIINEEGAEFETKKPFNIHVPIKGRGLGRNLILAPHLHVLRTMVEQDPMTTALDIERRLKALGIKFAAVSAVKNLARKHEIKLAT